MKNKNKLIKYLKNNNFISQKNKIINNLFSIKIGGKCTLYTEITDYPRFNLFNYLISNKIKYYLISNGTNTICPDKKYDGLIIKISNKFNKIYLENKSENNSKNNLLICQSGASLWSINNYCKTNGFKGLEFSFGIPGSIGGAVFMNAGAFGGEMKDVVEYVEVFDGEKFKKIYNKDCQFDYRDSIFKHNKNLIIVSVALRLEKGDSEEIENLMKQYLDKRLATQPYKEKSAGSVFKRIDDIIVSKAIDLMGLKGYSINDIQVSNIHAGFIINKGNGKFKDFINLVDYITREFWEKYNKKLELEVCIIE